MWEVSHFSLITIIGFDDGGSKNTLETSEAVDTRSDSKTPALVYDVTFVTPRSVELVRGMLPTALTPLCEERFIWPKQIALTCPVIEPFESFAKSKAFHIFSSTYAEQKIRFVVIFRPRFFRKF